MLEKMGARGQGPGSREPGMCLGEAKGSRGRGRGKQVEA